MATMATAAAMTARHPIVIVSSSSSPPPSPRTADNANNDPHRDARTPPSSPFGLSFAFDFVKPAKKAVKTGSRATPIPEGAVTGFRSASIVAKELVGVDGVDGNPLLDLEKTLGRLGPEMISRVEEEDEDVKSVSERSEVKLQPKPKPRRRRSDGSKLKLDKKPVSRRAADGRESKRSRSQSQMPKASVRESKGAKEDGAQDPVADLEPARPTFKIPPAYNKTSRYFQKKADKVETPEKAIRREENRALSGQDLALEQVTADPMATTNTTETIIIAEAMEHTDSPLGNNMEMEPQLENVPMAALCETAASVLNVNIPHVEKAVGPESQSKIIGDGHLSSKRPQVDATTSLPTKRQKTAKTKSPIKKKSVAKKEAVTITSKAIAHVKRPVRADDDLSTLGSQQGSSPQELRAFGIDQVNKPHITSNMPKKSTSKKGSTDGEVTKKKRVTAKDKKTATLEPKLRSPESAMRRFQRQEFLFGTSSQLVREEDPACLRDLQRALKASEAEADLMKPSGRAAPYTRTTLPQASRMLWSAGAQGNDEENSLLPTSAQESGESPPEIQKPNESGETFTRKQHPTVSRIDLTEGSGESPTCLDQSRDPKPPSSKLRLSSAPLGKKTLVCFGGAMRPQSPLTSHATVSQILSSHVASQAMRMSTKTATSSATTKSKSKAERKQKPEPKPRKRPNAATIATDDLQPAGKRPRGRPRKDDTTAPATPKKSKGKRKKAENPEGALGDILGQKVADEDGFVAIDDIQDDDPATPSPPRRHSPSVLGKLDMSGSLVVAQQPMPDVPRVQFEGHTAAEAEALKEAEARAKALARAEAQAAARDRLFTKITAAIKSAPRSADPKHPSWWEKMLLYDPIVIEDLTDWLNNGALEATGVPSSADTEAALLAGDDEGQGSGGYKFAVPLKPTVVQKWCEANSICCLWREGLRGGVKANY